MSLPPISVSSSATTTSSSVAIMHSFKVILLLLLLKLLPRCETLAGVSKPSRSSSFIVDRNLRCPNIFLRYGNTLARRFKAEEAEELVGEGIRMRRRKSATAVCFRFTPGSTAAPHSVRDLGNRNRASQPPVNHNLGKKKKYIIIYKTQLSF
ncbi:uncharacterized protein LOC127251567 [Andrographis paniculata]|uniref:uncharacterized protein LOC127251567 n=1 Tax=Andrographis paniculata TaxID=175694 RepID=UPI0021E6E3F5|nr:uncharacterized protein LOC127251567 [Andrographis paniculata]